MLGYTIRRLIALVPLLWAVATLTFLLMHSVPGGPFESGDRPLPQSTLDALERRYNLDGSFGEQYVNFIGNLATGDFGLSIAQNRPVTDIFEAKYPTTLQLGLCAFGFALILGLTLGVLSATNQNGIVDYLSVTVATIGVAVPNFVMAVFLVLIFSLQFGWFDVIGWEFGNYRKMVLPSVALGLLPAAYIARVTRASMLETLRQDYVRTARAKGLVERHVVVRHAARNAMIPVLTLLGPILAGLITGSFIIEQTFAIPGIGREFVVSIGNRDYGLIMGTVLLYAFLIAVLNLLVDLAYGIADPRVRY